MIVDTTVLVDSGLDANWMRTLAMEENIMHPWHLSSER